MQVKLSQLVTAMVFISLLVGTASWYASSYVNESSRLRQEHTDLQKERTELLKKLDECRGAAWRPGMPGQPIGNPAGATGSPTPLGSTPK